MRVRLVILALTGVVVVSIAVIAPWRPSFRPPRPAVGPAPRTTADRAHVQQLLRDERYDELETLIDGYQRRFEADARAEGDVTIAVAAFRTADPALDPLLDRWVARDPSAPIPRMVRAQHLVGVAWQRRGSKSRAETSDAQFRGMRGALDRAVDDAQVAIAARPTLMEAWSVLLVDAKTKPRNGSCRRIVDRALAHAPASFTVRRAHLHCLEPRWGGSYGAMEAFADEAEDYVEENPRLAHLRGLPDLDRGDWAIIQKDLAAADRHVAAAFEHGEEWEFLATRADLRQRQKRWREALTDIDRALELAPLLPSLLAERAYTLTALDRDGAAIADLEMLVRLDPTNDRLPSHRRREARAAVLAGYELAKEKRWDAAMERYTWAHQLAPGQTDALYWRGRAKLERKQTDAALADFEEAIRLDPHHIESIRNVDYILAKRGDWPAVIAHWDALIALEPENAEAHLERGGAYHHKGDAAEALADARTACDLGLAKACTIARRHGG